MMHHRRPLQTAAARFAFSLVEVTIALTVFSIVAVGIGVGMQAAVRTPEANDVALATSSELTSEMETWRAFAFGVSPWPTAFPSSVTDTVTLNVGGRQLTYPRITTIALWDPNNLATNTTPQIDFVQITITINGQTLTAYVSKTI